MKTLAKGTRVRAKVRTFGGWKGIGIVLSDYNGIVVLVPEGEDLEDRMKQKIFDRDQVSVIRKQKG